MSSRLRRSAALVVVALTSGCGIATGGSPTPIAASDVPYGLTEPTPTSAPASPAPARSDEPRVYFVTGEEVLVPRGRVVDGDTPLEQLTGLLDDLAAGPTNEELEDQLSTALPPAVRLSVTGIENGIAGIDVGGSDGTPSERESRRAVGQIVLSATSLPGIRRILLSRDGVPVEAPLPSGELTSAPLGAADYAALLAAPPP